MPDETKVTSFAVTQIGGWVKAILDDPEAYSSASSIQTVSCRRPIADVRADKEIDAVGDYVSIAKMAKAIADTFNVKVDTLHLTKEEFYAAENRQKPMPQVWLNWKAYYEGSVELAHTGERTLKTVNRYFVRDLAASKKILPEVWTFAEWVKQSDELRNLVKGS